MSERVKLADANVLSALVSTDYLLAERNGAIGRAALGESTLLTEAQRLWLEYYPKASGANILKCADFGDGYADAWNVSSLFAIEEGLLDRVNGLSCDRSKPTNYADVTQGVSEGILTSTWYTFSFWHKGAGISIYLTNCADTSVKGYLDGVTVTVTIDGNRNIAAVDDWTKHVYTIKTLPEITANVIVYFRVFNGDGTGYICQPKLERGPVATPWGG